MPTVAPPMRAPKLYMPYTHPFESQLLKNWKEPHKAVADDSIRKARSRRRLKIAIMATQDAITRLDILTGETSKEVQSMTNGHLLNHFYLTTNTTRRPIRRLFREFLNKFQMLKSVNISEIPDYWEQYHACFNRWLPDYPEIPSQEKCTFVRSLNRSPNEARELLLRLRYNVQDPNRKKALAAGRAAAAAEVEAEANKADHYDCNDDILSSCGTMSEDPNNKPLVR